MSVGSVPAVGAPATRSGERPVRDTWNVFVREIRPLLRDPFSVVFSLVQPLVFLGLFGPLLVGQAGGPAADTLVWFVPGIMVMTVLFGSGATGSNLLFEAQTGSHERTLVAPVSRGALLAGRALKEVVPIMAQAVLIVLAALPFGYRASVPGLILTLVLLAVFGIGLGSLSYTLAMASRKKDWMFWLVQQTLLFPLMILSGMLLPLEEGPSWMRAVASVNPISHIVDAARALLAGDVAENVVAYGFVAAVVLAALGLAVGITTMRRQT
ncbi:ABC transporter permease [Actinocorallia sp. API 0066]|uniref:ABC transporter permease n=1 Tax=Actinocorallia sp. API 0066 TaxID=2896846 RepID=UPI001E3860AD|nr:ABC transporter permease [Actinocorallia sp. API 0066]MCD0451537.1 ABC transporter permease [Actinocorallia sp. API 0066]